MFVLRKVSEGGKGLEVNLSLGKSYTLVTEVNDKEKVDECKKRGIIVDDPIIFGYVVGEDLEVHGLSVQQRNYIMTENGATFANVSL